MSIAGVIYGHIQTSWGMREDVPTGRNHMHLRVHNLQVLASLPEADPWPPLVRGMFGITGPTPMDGSYDFEVIHFGLSLKSMGIDDARAWIAKFEQLLRSLYWESAILHIDWIFGPRTFSWKADSNLIRALWGNPSPSPLDRWAFDDGGCPLETKLAPDHIYRER